MVSGPPAAHPTSVQSVNNHNQPCTTSITAAQCCTNEFFFFCHVKRNKNDNNNSTVSFKFGTKHILRAHATFVTSVFIHSVDID